LKVRVVEPVLAPTHPLATLTVYEIPAVWFAVLSVVVEGAVTTRPEPGAVNVTTMVLLPVSNGLGFTTIVAAAPGPVAVLHVTVAVGDATDKTAACNAAVPPVKASSATTALRPVLSVCALNVDESIRTPFLRENGLATSAGRRPIFRSLIPLSVPQNRDCMLFPI
jgi:hypothetical protein